MSLETIFDTFVVIRATSQRMNTCMYHRFCQELSPLSHAPFHSPAGFASDDSTTAPVLLPKKVFRSWLSRRGTCGGDISVRLTASFGFDGARARGAVNRAVSPPGLCMARPGYKPTGAMSSCPRDGKGNKQQAAGSCSAACCWFIIGYRRPHTMSLGQRKYSQKYDR